MNKTHFHLINATIPCQNVSFPNGTQFDYGRSVIWIASFHAVTRSDNESLNLKS